MVHLGRFMRIYLISCFSCVLVVPLLFNLAEIVFDRVQDPDLMYILCATIPAAISALYVYQQRQRINSDDLQFYVKRRLGRSKSFLAHYFTLTGLLVRELCAHQFDFKALEKAKESELQTALMVYKAHGPDDLYAIGNNEQMVINQQVAKLLPLVDNMFSLLALQGEFLALAQRSFMLGLRGQVSLESEFGHLDRCIKQRGQFFCEYVFTTFVRTIIRALPEEQREDYPVLLEHSMFKVIGSHLLQVDPERINSNYTNRYFNLLTQECFCLQRQAMGGGDCHQYFGHGERAYTFDGTAFSFRGFYNQDAHGAQGANGAHGSFGFDFMGGTKEAYQSAGSYYSYRDSYQDAYNRSYESYRQEAEAQKEREQAGTSGGSYAHAHSANSVPETKLQKAYRTLGLDDQASLSLVKKQYRKLVFKHHPDHIKDYMDMDEAHKAAITRRLQEIVQAYTYIICVCALDDESTMTPAAAS